MTRSVWIALGALLVVLLVVACGGGSGASDQATGDDSSDASTEATTPAGDDGGPVTAPFDATPTPFPGHDSGADVGGQDALPPDFAPAPTLASIAPTQALVGTTGPTIVCTGSGFVARSVVQLDGVELTTSFVSDTELRATIPDAKLAAVGTLHVTVGTAPPGGGGSAEVDFTVVNPSPAITALSPTSVLLGAADTPLTVTGSSFVTGATIAFGATQLPTTFGSATSLGTTIPASLLATSGQFPVTVTNPLPGGGTSTSIAFTVSNPTVTLSSVTPSTIVYGSGDTPIALAGSGFVGASAVSFNGTTIASAFVDAKDMTATVPGSMLGTAGDFPVVVTNPAPGGGVSTPVTVHVVYPAPTATSLAPSSVVLGSAPPTVVVTGSNFITGATTIALDGVAASTTVMDGTHASTTLTTQEVATAHVFQVTVTNASPGGGTSSALAFTVENPVPVATSLSPSSAVVGAGDTTVTVSGSAFEASSTVLLGGSPIATTYVDGSTLTAVVPSAQLQAAATLSISVKTGAPGGGTSPSLAFVVDNPGPTIASITPSSATAPSGAVPITVSGSGFVSGVSSVQINGGAVATTYSGSPLALGATIASSLLQTAGTLSITVANPAPGGGTSNVAYFTANNPAPTLSSVTPNSVALGAPDTSIALVGGSFVAGSVVKANGQTIASTYGDASHLSATVPAAMWNTASVTITVTNPAPGGGTSGGKTIAVTCNTSGADVVLTSLGAPVTLTLGSSLKSSPTTAYRIVKSLASYACPATDDTSAKEPYLAFSVVNATAQSATLSAWAECSSTSSAEDDSFMAFYATGTKPTSQSALEQCVNTVSEGSASGYDSPSNGGSGYCPGLTKSNGGGLTLGFCARAVIVVQPYDASSSVFTVPADMKVDLE
jgi:hypothetical protein